MSIEQHNITVLGLQVEIVKKNIKNLHLGVYPPAGRVRVAAPHRVSNEAVRLAVIGKLGWIKRQKATFELQPRQSTREMISGESHYFLGQRYRLRVYAISGRATVVIKHKTIELYVRQSAVVETRQKVMMNWYRQHLKNVIPPLLEKWQRRFGVAVSAFGIRKMKTKWGTCNPDARRIWINLELAKKSSDCLEYVVVHELAHLFTKRHDDQFIKIMDDSLPRWRSRRVEWFTAGPRGLEGVTYPPSSPKPSPANCNSLCLGTPVSWVLPSTSPQWIPNYCACLLAQARGRPSR